MAIDVRDLEFIGELPVVGGRGPEAVRRRVEFMEKLLEGLVRVPFTNRKVGLDVILDIVPVGGDVVAAALGAYMVWEARNLGKSRFSMLRMSANVGINALVGIIPLVGPVATFFYRSNTYNLRIIRKHLDRHHPAGAVIDQPR